MASAIYHFLNDEQIPERIQEAKRFERFARDLSQVDVRYAPLLTSNSGEQVISQAVVELSEQGDLLLRLEIEELHLNHNEKELVARCETFDFGDGVERHFHVSGLLRANEFILTPRAETVSPEKKVAIASLLHEVIFNGYFYSLIVKEGKMSAMSEEWQEVWKDFCFHYTVIFGEDTYWRANDPSDPILA